MIDRLMKPRNLDGLRYAFYDLDFIWAVDPNPGLRLQDAAYQESAEPKRPQNL